jgi:hypothetical protein
MKKGVAFVALMLLIGVAFWFYDHPKKPAPAKVALFTQNSASLLPKKLSAVPLVPAASAATNAVAATFSANPSSTQVPARQAGELKPDQSANTPVGPDTALQLVQHAVHQYGEMFGGNPVGTNPEITSQLTGNNPKHINFLSSQPGMQIDASGELVDAWGTPYFFHQLSGSDMEIHSAGPDKMMWTSDDLVVK